MTPENYYTAGILDGAGRIYDNALAVNTQCTRVCGRLLERYGGRIERTRWVLKSVDGRRRLLEDWLKLTQTREDEIHAALSSLRGEFG